MNGLDAVNIVFNRLKPLMDTASSPAGRLYRRQRPSNSNTEDIVIGNLAMDREDGVQQGLVNINIHVPNLQIASDGLLDNSIPDLDRLNELTKVVESYFPIVSGEYIFEVQSDDLYEEDGSSYQNIRIEVNAINFKEN